MVAPFASELAALVVLVDLALALLVLGGLARATRRVGLEPRSRVGIVAGAAAVLALWFGSAYAVTRTGFGPLDLPVLALIGGPVVLGYGLYAVSPTWRRLVRATPHSWLVGVQAYRVIGAVFLLVWAAGGLPAYFAIPAGVGDVLTGVGALGVASLVAGRRRRWRGAALGWNAFGLADLVVAVGAGSTLLAGPLSTVLPAETTTAAVVAFPLGLIPTFLVPISVLLHLYSATRLLGAGDVEPAGTARYRETVR
jgi:hypothetical protein